MPKQGNNKGIETMEKQWNSVYKRFECLKCGEAWNIGEIHSCPKVTLSYEDEFWRKLPHKTRQEIRKDFNLLPEDIYNQYENVAFYAVANYK